MLCERVNESRNEKRNEMPRNEKCNEKPRNEKRNEMPRNEISVMKGVVRVSRNEMLKCRDRNQRNETRNENLA
jgi:hypothetical protein